MFELTINGDVFGFNFGMGFLREVNKEMQTPIDGVKDATQNVGLRYKIAGLIDGDPEALVDVLDAANKGQKPRVTRQLLDAYIDDGDTDIDVLFADVIDFLSKANATKKTTAMLLEVAEREKAKQAANQ